MKTAQVIINVGWLRDAVNNPNFGTAYLAQDDQGNYFIIVWKAAFKAVDGTDVAAGWGWISKDAILSGSIQSNISNSVKALLRTDPIFGTDEIVTYNNLKAGVITNGATLAALATNIKPTVAEIPAMYTAVGTGFDIDTVKEELGLSGLTLPQSSTIVASANAAMAYPELQTDPVGAIQTFLSKPLEFAKANPISAGAIAVGAWEIGAFALGAKNSPLIMLGVRKAPRRGRR